MGRRGGTQRRGGDRATSVLPVPGGSANQRDASGADGLGVQHRGKRRGCGGSRWAWSTSTWLSPSVLLQASLPPR
jgi:hypothetical protein